MNYKHVFKSIVTGHWDGVEVHDRELLAKYTLYALGLVLLIGISTSIPSCTDKPDYPPHIQVNG